MEEVDLREENQISKRDKLLRERWDTQIISALEEHRRQRGLPQKRPKKTAKILKNS